MKEKVVDFLLLLGVTNVSDDPLIDIVINNVCYKVFNKTNTSDCMTKELENIAVDMAVGEYLKFKKTCGQLDGFDLETTIKQIKEGDTSIQYAIGEGNLTPEQRLDIFIESLIERSKELYKFRRLVW